ncbi:SDR family oxidoreductase [Candidatus Parvarchaeota archaeon]|jgi:dTDP-4-dehydrorhamnose reductase|nr:SDR family oxidoreductase [Candidatus Parvarchaeota archaeon]
MKILVLGGSGFVGYYLAKHFNATSVSAHQKEGYVKLDITNKEEVSEVLNKIKPELIINSAAIADVDLCEKEKETAMLVNGYAVGWLSSLSKEIGAKFVQISTDYVFDGLTGNYTEEDNPNPINEYGKSKLIGEENSLKNDAIVLRIEMPYGINIAKNKNVFFESVINNLKEGKTVNAAVDQIISPTFVEDIPKAVEVLVEKGANGIFHLASKEHFSRFEFVNIIADVFNFDKTFIKPVKLADFKMLAKRPKNTFLNTEKISKLYEIKALRANLEKIKTGMLI